MLLLGCRHHCPLPRLQSGQPQIVALAVQAQEGLAWLYFQDIPKVAANAAEVHPRASQTAAGCAYCATAGAAAAHKNRCQAPCGEAAETGTALRSAAELRARGGGRTCFGAG